MKRRMWVVVLCLMCMACLAIGTTVAAFAADEEGGSTPEYTKVAFASVTASEDPYSANLAASNAIDGDKSTYASIAAWGQTGYLQCNSWLDLAFEEVKTIDRLAISLPNTIHTSTWRIEVSKDNKNWSLADLKERTDTEIVNTAVRSKNREKEIIVDFAPVACKYVRLINLVKEIDGTNCLALVSEVEAYTSGAQAEEAATWQKFEYTLTDSDATWKQAGSTSFLNDGKNKYFVGSGDVVVFAAGTPGNATVTLSLTKKMVPSFVRIYPHGYETKSNSPIVDSAVNEDALVNTQVAKGLKFEGYADGKWTTIKEYTNIPSYIFSQDFDISTDKTLEKVRIVITEKGENSDFVAFAEVELFGSIAGDYVILKEESNAKKTYTEGEELDLGGFKIAKVTVDQETAEETEGEAVAITEAMLKSEFDPWKIGTQKITVEYEGMIATFDVTVNYAAVSGKKLTLTDPSVLPDNKHLTPIGEMGKLINGNKSEEVILGVWGETGYYNTFEPMTFTIADSDLTDGKAVVDKMRIYFKPGNVHTARFMIEASVDGEKWARVNYTAADDIVIENNAVGLKLPSHSDYMTVNFAPVYAKYLRVTYLIKNLDGTNALSKLTEIEAYASEDATVTGEPIYAAKQSYTYTAVSADGAGTTDGALNDGEKMYFGMKKENNEIFQPEVLVLYGGKNDEGESKTDASVTFTLENFVNVTKIRLFPDGIKANSKQSSALVNEDAFVNTAVPKAFKVEGSADGETYTTLGEFNDVKPYTFAQEFELEYKFTVKYIRLVILETNELSTGSNFSEIEIFANAVEDFSYVKEQSARFNDGKLIYAQNEELDLDDLTITVTDNAGGVSVQTIAVTADMVKNFSTVESGEKTATIEYNSLTCDYDYVVAEVDSVTISKMPDKTVYFVGEELDVTGMEITANYHYGEDKTGSVVIKNVAKFVTLDTSAANNEAKLTVVYSGKTVSANVVVREVSSIAIKSTSHKTSYYMGAKLDVTGLEIEVTYTDNNKETIAVTADMVTGFTSAKATDKLTLTVTYSGKTTTFDVEIKAVAGAEEKTEKKGCGCGSDAVGESLFASIVLLTAACVLAIRKKSRAD